MALPPLRVFEPFYRKHKEALLYLFFGGLTTAFSIAVFALFNAVLGVNELVANIISWILAVAFAFFTNRIWVFSAPAEGKGSFLKQMLSFFGGRLFTLAVEEAVLFVFVSRLRFPGIAVKTAAQVLVIVLNYVISKWIVFRA
ncbi:MAG: GtrA family protein [Oscillospiraceae bacterium]|nr:GtrA family protein [Oscillospiraceae bacterium]